MLDAYPTRDVTFRRQSMQRSTLLLVGGGLGIAVACQAPHILVRGLLVVASLGVVLWALTGFGHGRRLRNRMMRLVSRHHHDRDALSGLANRQAFRHRLQRCVARTDPAAAPFALLYIDLEGLRDINDTHGTATGDALIAAAAARLAKILNAESYLARIGGDEFAIIAERAGEHAIAARLAADVLDAMKSPFDAGGRQVQADGSIGIALSPRDLSCADTLMRCADAALRRAKKAGKGHFQFFDGIQDGLARDERALVSALRSAIDRDELLLHYQPVIAADTLEMCGVEALLRWGHPERGLLTPANFIPIAEAHDLLPSIGEWVLRQACRDGARWPGLRVAVNVSPAQFRHEDFVATVIRVLEDTQFDPQRLEVELTESVIIDDAEQAARCIIDLRAMGIRVAIDDFGTGYSSLIYLRRFAFDKMKIDKSFVQVLDGHGEGAVIIDAIVRLGQALGLTITAEGIETVQQQSHLRALNCDEFQGYLYAPPVTADEIDALLVSHRFGEREREDAASLVRSVA